MPDTLIDPIPPPVNVDPDAAEARPAAEPTVAEGGLRPTVLEGGPPPAPRPAAGSRKGCFIAAASAVLTVLGVVALALYFFVWRYEPLARRHIPGDANLVLRLEGAEIALFAPVRKHLWPLLEETSSGEAPANAGSRPPSKTRSARIKDATGVNVATDVREILVASTDAASWVMLVGGRIPPGRFVSGLERVAREEGWVGWRRSGDLLLGPGGVSVGQADDGTIAIGTEGEIVRAALPASDEWKRLDLPQQGAVTFAITREAWGGMGGAIGGMLPRGGAGLFRRASRATGVMTLGETPALTMQIHPVAGETPATLASDVETIVGDLKLLTLLLPDVVGEKGALRSTRVTPKGGAVEVHADWPLDGLERACERLARLLRDLRPAPAPP